MPGEDIPGVPIRDGSRKTYKMNGFRTFVAVLSATGAYIGFCGPESFTFLYDRFLGFATAGLVLSVTTAVWVYVSSFRSNALLALGGNSGNHIYDVRILPLSLLYQLN